MIIFLFKIILVAATGVLVWKVAQLVRAPRNRALWAIVVCQVAAIANNLFALPSIAQRVDKWLVPGMATILFNGVLVVFFYSLLCFYLYACHRELPDQFPAEYTRRRIQMEGWLCVGILAGMASAMAATPAPLRAAQYVDADRHSLGLALFYLIHSAYVSYALISAIRLARLLAQTKERKRTAPRTALGLRLSAMGLVWCLVGGPVERIPATAVALLGGRPPHSFELIAACAVTAGIVLFAGGIVYPPVVDVLTTARLWASSMHLDMRLRRLWRPLVTEFPDQQLHVTVWKRPGRRVIETLDCLEALGPWMAPPSADETIDQETLRVHDGLRRKAAGEPPVADTWEPNSAVRSIVRGNPDELAHLMRLARAFTRLASEGNKSVGVVEPQVLGTIAWRPKKRRVSQPPDRH